MSLKLQKKGQKVQIKVQINLAKKSKRFTFLSFKTNFAVPLNNPYFFYVLLCKTSLFMMCLCPLEWINYAQHCMNIYHHNNAVRVFLRSPRHLCICLHFWKALIFLQDFLNLVCKRLFQSKGVMKFLHQLDTLDNR